MYYSAIYKYDVINSTGFHVSLFISGCIHRCDGCFQPETWNFKFGKLFTDDTIDEIIEALSPDYISSFCLLGGDPIESSGDSMLEKLLVRIKKEYGDEKQIWVWSGYTYQQIISDDSKLNILKYCDVLIDGKFIKELKNLNLAHRGSSNQEVILVQESLKQNKVVLYES
ncbi:anaerobic ribonucleoside-triphosphate reductase activating protein [Paenibacillus sp. NRS-1775]|uniref:anaerobic ribonucleoside-triphosphate reductase activating protein n=1 Tax=unclassified Paenibacillus TaxID=185978 RepID=UPI003D2C7A75